VTTIAEAIRAKPRASKIATLGLHYLRKNRQELPQKLKAKEAAIKSNEVMEGDLTDQLRRARDDLNEKTRVKAAADRAYEQAHNLVSDIQEEVQSKRKETMKLEHDVIVERVLIELIELLHNTPLAMRPFGSKVPINGVPCEECMAIGKIRECLGLENTTQVHELTTDQCLQVLRVLACFGYGTHVFFTGLWQIPPTGSSMNEWIRHNGADPHIRAGMAPVGELHRRLIDYLDLKGDDGSVDGTCTTIATLTEDELELIKQLRAANKRKADGSDDEGSDRQHKVGKTGADHADV